MKTTFAVLALCLATLGAAQGAVQANAQGVKSIEVNEHERLLVENAAAKAEVRLLERQITHQDALVQTAQQAVNEANEMQRGILGVAALILAIGGFGYVKAALEDRRRIRKSIERYLLPRMRHLAESRIAESIEMLEASHLRRYYRSLADYYFQRTKQCYDDGLFGFTIAYALHATASAFRSRNTTVAAEFMVKYRDLFVRGETFLRQDLEDVGPDHEELDSITIILANTSDEEVQEGLTLLVALIQESAAMALEERSPVLYKLPSDV